MQPEKTIDEMLAEFVHSMVQAKGDANADQEKLREGLADAIDTAVLNALPTETLEKMVALEDSGQLSGEVYDKFLHEAGIDQNNIVMEAMIGYRDAYLNGEVA